MCPVDTTAFSTPASTRQGLDRQHLASWLRRVVRHWQSLLLLCALSLGLCGSVLADPPELTEVSALHTSDGVYLTARLKLQVAAEVEDALLKGVPLYFAWRADLVRDRWYWTDKTVASAVRTWRLVYQPLTGRWRLSLSTDANGNGAGSGLQYALHQNFDTLDQALAGVSRVVNWRVARQERLDADLDERIEWRFRLDLTLLPRPFQIGVANQSGWVIEVAGALPVPPLSEPPVTSREPGAPGQ